MEEEECEEEECEEEERGGSPLLYQLYTRHMMPLQHVVPLLHLLLQHTSFTTA